jgi:hypothetical protein
MNRLLSLQQLSGVRCASTLVRAIDRRLETELDSIRQAGTWKNERIISTSQSAHIKVEHSTNQLLNFCANNYLGLANNEQVVQAAKTALNEYGAGLSSVRFICGTQTIHKQRNVDNECHRYCHRSIVRFAVCMFVSRRTYCSFSST